MKLADYINNLNMNAVAETLKDGTTGITLTNVEQDFYFNVSKGSEIYDYWQNFDIEEEVYMWLQAKEHGVKGVPYVTELVAEEQLIEDTLHELALKTIKFEEV